MDFEIITDSSSNFSEEEIDALGLHILPLTFMVDGEQFYSYVKGRKTDLKQFFDMMRDGKVITTSLPSMSDTEELLRGLLDQGKDLLYIGFSSGLSGTYQSTSLLCKQLEGQYPDRTILYVDTLAASGGEGLIVREAVRRARAGASIQEVHQWVEDSKLKYAHWFTVDDLMYLFRGGRVSKTSAWAGTMLNIKPVMHVDDEGHLIPMEKVRGRKKSLNALVDHMLETIQQPAEEQPVYLTHGDCHEDAEYVAKRIREKVGCTDITMELIDPVIGAHTGPGIIALFFPAEHRN